MFTGIIESMGQVREIFSTGSNKSFWISSPLSDQFTIDQSIAHNGACLTIEEVRDGMHRVTAIDETLKKTNLHQWQVGSGINLERSLVTGGRLDGHFVQGHVDACGTCKKIREKNGSTEIEIRFPKKFADLVIEKGSIALNGISLTIFDVKKDAFKVAIIPYTIQHTNLQHLKEDEEVNLEFDMIGKYIARKLSLEK